MVSKCWLRQSAVLLSLLLVAPAWALSSVTATVDKNPVMAGEPFLLEIVADGRLSAQAFSSHPLLALGYVVGSTTTSSQTSIINGESTQTTRWRTNLLLRKPGIYTIPAFSIGGLQTQPIELQVIEAPKDQATDQEPIFITAELNQQSVYPGQQLLYKVRIHLSGDLARATLKDPHLTGATIERMEQDKRSSTIIDGVRYQVIERTYTVVPNLPGEFTIQGPVLNGQMLQRDARGRQYAMPISIAAPEEVKLVVNPPPDTFPGNWLPAESVAIREQWEPDVTITEDALSVGMPVTRTLIVQAVGAHPDALPGLEVVYPDLVKVYPDNPATSHYVLGEALVAERSEPTALIFSQAGTVILPEIRIPWWNIRTQAVEYAVLPARTLQVAPAAPALGTANPAATSPAAPVQSTFWQLTTALLALGWLLTIAGWLWQVRRHRPAPVEPAETASVSQAWQALRSALRANDQLTAPARLHTWLGQRFGDRSLQVLAEVCEPAHFTRIEQEYRRLCASRYAPQGGSWQGAALLALLTQVAKPRQDQPTRALPALYPKYP